MLTDQKGNSNHKKKIIYTDSFGRYFPLHITGEIILEIKSNLKAT